MSSQIARTARLVRRELHGVVVSSGLMGKTAKVRVGGQKWNKIVHKVFANPKHHLVHDPNSSLRTGDVVAIAPGWPTSRHKRHYVKHIIAAHGVPVSERPPIPTLEEMIVEREAKKTEKDERRTARRQEDAQNKQTDRTRKGDSIMATRQRTGRGVTGQKSLPQEESRVKKP